VNGPSDRQIAAWYPRLLRTALRMTGRQEDAADLTQQAFCKALDRWEQFDGSCQPTTWLHSILVNCVRDWLRRRSVQTAEPLAEWDLPASADEHASPALQLEVKEQTSRLRRAIASLPEELRVVFVAALLDGYTYQEIAEMLAVPVGTVGHRIYRARRIVESQMREWFPEA